MRTVHVIDAGNVPAPVNVVGETITILAGGDLSKPFEVHIQEGVKGGGPPPHFHPWDEAFLVIDGQVEVTVEGKATLSRPVAMCISPAARSMRTRTSALPRK